MPSLRTRISYAGMAASNIEATVAVAQAALAEAAVAVAEATDTLEEIETGVLDLEAVTVGGQRFINNGGVLEPEP